MSSGLALEAEGGRWKRYPAYKDSGVEWLGVVPEGWGITCIKRLAEPGYKTFVDGDWIETPFITDEGIRLIQTGNIGIGAYKEQGFRYIEEKTFHAFNCTEVKPRDVLICRLAEPVGRACLAPDLGVQMITSVDVCILKPNNYYDARFIVYFLSSDIYLGCINSLSRGSTRERVSRSMLGNIELVAPPLSEQHAIAAFLDRETGCIDALIAKKERQIELMREKRAALISHAVTKGLDPDAPMKDSGVEWLGEVPEHWEMLALKRLASLKSGESITVESIDKDGDYPVFGGNGLRGYTTTFTHDGNYVLIGRQGALCGNINYAQGHFWASEHAVVVSPIRPVETKWLGELLRAMNLNQYSVSAAQPGLSAEMVSNLSIPHPPLQEQSTIAAFLDRETGYIDTLTTKVRESITKLREYRTALISAAVTGKIDVREELVS